jgi:hypothetical protein
VVGGIYIKMLTDRAVWKKWASRDQAKVGPWAPLPEPPEVVDIVPTSQHKKQRWHYTFEKPADNWTEPEFDDHAWKEGPGGFGTRGTPGAVIGTKWNTGDIWIRRTFTMPQGEHHNIRLSVYHDEDIEVYINGVLAASATGFENSYQPMDITATAMNELKSGDKLTLAAHCHQTVGGQGVDVGICEVKEK